jgi:hypothetical protein
MECAIVSYKGLINITTSRFLKYNRYNQPSVAAPKLELSSLFKIGARSLISFLS